MLAPGTTPPGQRSLAATLARGGGWQALAQFAPLIGNLLLTPYLISGLGLDRYGLFILVNAIAVFVGSFDGGICASAMRYLAIYAGTDDRHASTSLLVSLSALVLGVGTALFALLFLLTPPLLSRLDLDRELLAEGQFLMRTLAVIIAFGLLRGLFAAVLNARQKFALTSLTNVALYGVNVVGVVVTISNGYGLRGLAVTLAAQAVVSAAVIIPSACRYLTLARLRWWSWSELADFTRYSMRVQATGLASLVNIQADALILGAFLPVRNVGLYSTGATFSGQLRSVPINLLGPAQSALGNALGNSSVEEAERQFIRVQRLWVLGTSAWSALAAGAAYFGIVHWLGPDFRLAGLVATVLLAGYALNLWTGALTVWLAVLGRPEVEARAAIVGVLVNILLTMSLIVPFGLVGVVAATAAAQSITALYLMRLARRRVVPRPPSFLGEVPWKGVLATIATVVVVELATYRWIPGGAPGLLLAGLAAAPAAFVFGVVALGVPATRELALRALRALRVRTGVR